jgi:hypothetical protein
MMNEHNKEMTEKPEMVTMDEPCNSSSVDKPPCNPIYKTLRPEYGNIVKYSACKVCKPLSAIPMRHYHHSTKYFHNTLLARNEGLVNCPTCKVEHLIHQWEERVTVIMSTSSLHNCFLYESVKPEFHVNIESISGGTIDMLRASWVQLYWEESRPMNVIVVAGLNDVPNCDYERITGHITLFKKVVNEQNPANFFLMTGILRPPKLAWFAGNGPEPPLPFGNFYRNHLEKINRVNQFIHELSKQSGVVPLSFAGMGTRLISKRDSCGARYRVQQHQFTAWREFPVQHMMLHLNDQKRAMMYNRTIKHIKDHVKPLFDE